MPRIGSRPQNPSRRICSACDAVLVGSGLRLCVACGASLGGPLAPGASPILGAGASARTYAARSDSRLPAALAAVLALAAILLFLSTTPGCASTEAAPPPPPRPVPDLVGQPRIEAEQTLARAGLVPKYSWRYGEVDLEMIVEQKPAAGVAITPPEPVEMVVLTRRPR